MNRKLSVTASHSRRAMNGWKNRGFSVSVMMLDLVEVFSDFYDPKDFVQFGTGADRGLKMMKYTKGEFRKHKHPSSYNHTRGSILEYRIKEYLLANPTMCKFLGCRVRKEKGCQEEKEEIIINLTGRPLHYGDFADQFTCKNNIIFQWTSASRLHNDGSTCYAHEFPIKTDKNHSLEEMWPKEIINAMKTVLDELKKRGKEIPEIGPSFRVDNEEEWKQYCLTSKKTYDGAWGYKGNQNTTVGKRSKKQRT